MKRRRGRRRLFAASSSKRCWKQRPRRTSAPGSRMAARQMATGMVIGRALERARVTLLRHEDRHLRVNDLLLVGQWPRDALARALPGAGGARTRDRFLRARCAVLRRAPGFCGTARWTAGALPIVGYYPARRP